MRGVHWVDSPLVLPYSQFMVGIEAGVEAQKTRLRIEGKIGNSHLRQDSRRMS